MNDNIKFITGNCLEILKTISDNSVQCCVTSPPYFGLRDYGTAKWEGGDAECKHYVSGDGEHGSTHAGEKQQSNHGSMRVAKKTCPKCGAIRIDDQIGLEESPEIYIAKLVDVFREVWRALKDDGSLWLNLGDSYAGSNMTGGNNGINKSGGDKGFKMQRQFKKGNNTYGFKPKDLIGIPWMVAFALRTNGWYLRSDIIWAKTNPMPESIKDRPTKSHEYIFLLAKSNKYFYDYQAVLEPATGYDGRKDTKYKGGNKDMAGGAHERWQYKDGQPLRNQRDVWTINTKPYKEAHFATFPEEIPTRCIKAGSKIGDIVLDPFNGAGTTGLVCAKLGRKYIGIDINENYIELSRKRIENVQISMLQ